MEHMGPRQDSNKQTVGDASLTCRKQLIYHFSSFSLKMTQNEGHQEIERECWGGERETCGEFLKIDQRWYADVFLLFSHITRFPLH